MFMVLPFTVNLPVLGGGGGGIIVFRVVDSVFRQILGFLKKRDIMCAVACIKENVVARAVIYNGHISE
jgi:hypothetical protein